MATSLLYLVGGGGLKASLWWGDKTQKIGGSIFAVVLVCLAQWLSSGFSVHLFGYPLSGAALGVDRLWYLLCVCRRETRGNDGSVSCNVKRRAATT
jgi:hypothetical protein